MKKQDVIDAMTWDKIYDEYDFGFLGVSDRYAISYAFSKVQEKLGLKKRKSVAIEIVENEIKRKKSPKTEEVSP